MKKVSLFIPCTVDILLPEIGEETLYLLERLGVSPIYHKEQTCCGQPALNAGYVDQARRAAKHFIEVFGEDEVVVSPSGSCLHTAKYRYPELLSDEPVWLRRAEDLSSRLFELSQYIVDVLEVEDVGASFDGKVTYHESCQILRGLGVSEQPKKLITAVNGVEFVPLNNADKCCGFGGEFANNYPDISEEMVKDKTENYINSGADVLVLCEPGCLLNINGYLSRNHPEKKALHIATLLADTEGEVRL
ncbi:MAG: (Fe-S)-binding protein [Thermodesulfobacteriota bacterium]|nr:(Fe-S)-binding protein [Thermodesulfobacteriota bacterium]